MSNSIHIETLFPKYLFWDVNMSALNIEQDKDLIIPRALIATTPNTFTDDIVRLEKLYPKAVIVRELKATTEKVSDHICKLVAQRYHIKKFARFAK